MPKKVIFTLADTPTHPNFTPLYQRLGLDEVKFTNMRKAMSSLKKQVPDAVVCEFVYGFSNNYAGVNISNLDVMLFSLQKFAPSTKVIVMVSKSEQQYVGKLNNLFPLHAVLVQPVSTPTLEDILTHL